MRTTVRGLRRLIRELTLKKDEDVYLSSNSDDAKQIEPEIFDMITKAYQKVGGNPKIKTSSDIGKEYPNWIVSDVDGDSDIDSFLGGRPINGKMKLGVSATDGSIEAKNHMQNLKKQLFSNGWWAEVSDAPAHIALNKLKIKPVEDEEKVRKLLSGKNIKWFGAHPEGKFPNTFGWYSRNIGNEEHIKIIVGDI